MTINFSELQKRLQIMKIHMYSSEILLYDNFKGSLIST